MVKIEWTLQVFENIEPKERVKPAIRTHAYGGDDHDGADQLADGEAGHKKQRSTLPSLLFHRRHCFGHLGCANVGECVG